MIFLTYDIQLLLLATGLGWIVARLFALRSKTRQLAARTHPTILFLFLWFLIQHWNPLSWHWIVPQNRQTSCL